MESWSYVSSERGFVSEDSVIGSGVTARGRNGSMDWEFKTSYGGNNIGLESSNQYDIEDMGILDLGLQETMRKSVFNGSPDDKLSGVRMFSSVTENAFWEEKSSNFKPSSSVMEFNCADSSLVDLKLGRFDDQTDAQKSSISRVASDMYPTDSSSKMGKRSRVGVTNSLTPYCQVLGCNRDLSTCKDYHKRHKVCEVHSKTPKVIVNDIEQRFCQQCSRFHLLVEFDDGKRSCRKRLAGHNERRRKPHTGRSGRLYHTYNSASRFQGTAVPTSSYHHQDVVPGSLSQQQRYERNNSFKHIKLEEGADYSSQSTITFADGGLHLNSPYGLDKHCLSIERNGVYDNSINKSNGNTDQYMFRNASFGGEAFTGFDSTPIVQALSGFSNSGRALSLLSHRSQTSSNHTSDIPSAYPLIIPGSHEPYSVTQLSENEISHKFISAGIDSFEDHFDQVISTSSGNATVTYGIDGMFHGSDCMNVKAHLSSKDEPTIDLLQLSSQLQQVEDQRQYLLEKPRDVSFL